MTTLHQLRDATLQQAIQRSIHNYLHGIKSRRCAWCGALFNPQQRYHFFHDPDCRKSWYAGQFRPRERKTQRRRKAA